MCGGANGVVKIVDLRTFAVLQTFSALPPTMDALQVGPVVDPVVDSVVNPFGLFGYTLLSPALPLL